MECSDLMATMCTYLFNIYRGYPLIIFRQNKSFIVSKEGTTQGDPMGMLMYAIGTIFLIRNLKGPDWCQNWYADDSSCMGKLENVRRWFDILRMDGPKWGYYPEPTKSYLIIKPGLETEARRNFQDLNVQLIAASYPL